MRLNPLVFSLSFIIVSCSSTRQPELAPALQDVKPTARSMLKMEVAPVAAMAPPMPMPEPPRPQVPFNTEEYSRVNEQPYLSVLQNPLSTFALDVDTASYSNVRRMLNAGTKVPVDAVRIEELINYFRYDLPAPEGDRPFSVSTELAQNPWAEGHLLARISLQGKRYASGERPAKNLVFLIDRSGSMADANKLPLVKKALEAFVPTLGEADRVALIGYAGETGVILPPTSGRNKEAILAAIATLDAHGSTNGMNAMQVAYDLVRKNFIKDGINRVVMATDGDFNVGISSTSDLTRMIESQRESGAYLTILGFGLGNYKDGRLEAVADAGNGNYEYIDNMSEARKVLIDEADATFMTIAKDVKLQIEFNPEHVAAYRLIGYENRALRDEDFRDDHKDAGELGAGHTVTALYDVVPVGTPDAKKYGRLPLKYQAPPVTKTPGSKEMLTAHFRWKDIKTGVAAEHHVALVNESKKFEQASENLRFAAAVAGFGMLLRQSDFKGNLTYDKVKAMASQSLGSDQDGTRHEFMRLIDLVR